MNDDEGAKAPRSALRAATSPAIAEEEKAPPGDGARGRSHTPHPARASRESPSPSRGEGLRISPNKNRIVQVRRAGKRKLFDKARKEVFLEWLAATCNVALSSEKAGICDKTVYKHLLKDPAFVDAFVQAVQVGYLRLEARQMQEAQKFGSADGVRGADVRPTPAPPCQGGESYEIRILDDSVVEEHFDPALAMQLLREHRRHLPGSAETRPAQRTTARAATSEEVVKALAKRLKGFALRQGSGQALRMGSGQAPSA